MSHTAIRQMYERQAPDADIARDMGLPNKREKIITLDADTAAAYPGDMQKAAMTAMFANPGFIPGRGMNCGKRDSA